MRPQSYGSSTTGVKKSAVATIAVPPASRTTAASSPSSRPTSSSPWPRTPGPASPATTSSSSPGGILQAQPPPWAYWVRRTASVVVAMRGSLSRGYWLRLGGWLSGGGVRVAGAPRGLQNRRGRVSRSGGFDSRPPPQQRDAALIQGLSGTIDPVSLEGVEPSLART